MLGVIGDVVQDIVVWTEEEVRHATDTKSQISMTRGGSAANVAAFAGRRHPTRFIGCVGNDIGGHVVEQELASHGVDVRLQRRGDTGMIVVIIDRAGERDMFPSRGASGLLGPVDQRWLQDLRILHITGYSLQDEPAASSVIAAARTVKSAGGKISFDVSSTGMIDLYGLEAFVDLMADLEPDYISANQAESAMLSLADEHGPGPRLEHVGGVLLARAGKKPTRIMRGRDVLAAVPVQPAEVVRDLTGAGDAFNAGFLTAILGETSPEPDLVAAVEAAHALARRVLAHAGASEGDDTLSPD
ncbi:MAG TPA: carbohydrate kinase family protein [Jiangellaceae bacterium]|nr:carbohydrate kinase family protein [Jiangellaceae bacterium]